MEKSKKGKEEFKKIKRQFSAGGVVFKPQTSADRKAPLWLLTKSNPSKKFSSVWRLPKGWIDDKNGGKLPGPVASGLKKAKDKELRKAAVREVKEEAGVEADIVEKIGTETYFPRFKDEKIMKFVTFYLMKWKKDLPGGFGFETSEIVWLPFEKARRKLSYSGEKKILDKAKRILAKKV